MRTCTWHARPCTSLDDYIFFKNESSGTQCCGGGQQHDTRTNDGYINMTGRLKAVMAQQGREDN